MSLDANSGSVSRPHEQATPYRSWKWFGTIEFNSEAEKHSHLLIQLLNMDRKSKKEYTDGILQVENKTFAVHKCILTPSSEYFKKLFFVPMQDGKENVTRVTILTPERLERVLEFVYSGYSGLTDENVCITLEDAVFVKLIKLQEICWQFMRRRMNADNCFRFLTCATMHREMSVSGKANTIISENIVKSIQREEFLDLPFDEVLRHLKWRKIEIVEEEILTFNEKWMKRHPDHRKVHFLSLMELVDFSFVSSKFIKERIKMEKEMVLHPVYMNMLQKELRDRENEQGTKCGSFFSEKNIVVLGKSESWVMNIRSQEKQQLPHANDCLYGESAVKADEKLLVLGGRRCERPSHGHPWNEVEQLDLCDPTKWHESPPLNVARHYAACVILNDVCYVTGGKHKRGEILRSCESFQLNSTKWENHSKMITARMSHGMVVLNGSLYVMGGWINWPLPSVERYDQSNEKWVSKRSMRRARYGFGAAVLNNKIFVIGGKHFKDDLSVETYCESANQWSLVAAFNVSRKNVSAIVLGGKIFVVGGFGNAEEKTSDEVVCYDPSSNVWSTRFRLKVDFPSTVLAI